MTHDDMKKGIAKRKFTLSDLKILFSRTITML